MKVLNGKLKTYFELSKKFGGEIGEHVSSMYTLLIIAFTIYGSGMIMQPFILPSPPPLSLSLSLSQAGIAKKCFDELRAILVLASKYSTPKPVSYPITSHTLTHSLFTPSLSLSRMSLKLLLRNWANVSTK